MPSVDRMREFLAVMDAGSISEAARVLGVPRATLSRRMASMEADLGVRLIIRRTTRLALTHAGEELLRRAQRIVADADAAWDAVRRLDDTPRGLLRVSVTGPHFLKLFTEFLCDFPEVRLEVQSTTRHVDLLADGVDVAMRIGPVEDKDLIVRQVHRDRTIVVASPDYLAANGTPQTAEALKDHRCIVGFAGGWTPRCDWPLLNGGTVNVGGRLSANEVLLIREAAIAGLGCALIGSAVVARDVTEGRLVPVLTDKVGADLPINLVYADREFVDPKIREFVDRAVKVISREMPAPLKIELSN
ncbi:MAG: LysR family transcriptional regulator [Silicimonas sp.]|nr:LysR family transcriptional regulator [Silicimonas sp.]